MNKKKFENLYNISVMDDELNYWNQRYINREVGWDLGRHHPWLPSFLKALKTSNVLKPKVWVPGAGSGHCAAYLSLNGCEVFATDISSRARIECVEQYPNVQIDYEVKNIFQTKHQEGFFDAIYDRAMWVALQPESQKAYIDFCIDKLKKGGLFFSITFTKGGTVPPPNGITLDQKIEMIDGQARLIDFQAMAKENQLPECASLWEKN